MINIRVQFLPFFIFTLLTTTWSYTYSEADSLYDDNLKESGFRESFVPKSKYYYGKHNQARKTKKSDEVESTFGSFEPFGAGDSNADSWSGKWFPKRSSKKELANPSTIQKDEHNRVKMGVANTHCDDGKTNLTNDWDGSPMNYTCYHPDNYYPIDPFKDYVVECDDLPPTYTPGHKCMDQPIKYEHNIPTHGDHRPLWPMFGEYVFVPRERWLHNIEHGAIVMLYHPCAHPEEVKRLKKIVTSCIGKHVITPSTLLSREHPLALVAWGCRLRMALVDEEAAVNFIEQKALKGPEGLYTKEGQFDHGLIESANRTGAGARVGYAKVECDSSSFM